MVFSWIGHSVRLARVAVTLARYDVLLPGEYYERYPIWLQSLRTLTIPIMRKRRGKTVGARLASALERLGPAYVKVGQFLATRADIIGVTAAQDLARLKDRLPPFPRERALDTINAELGGTESIFGPISDPMAAASIAQVHQANIARHGLVAIKVLRPNIEGRLYREMAALRFLAQGIELFSPKSRRLEPVQFIDTVGAALERELDLRLEAGAAAEFKDVAEAEGYLSVPNIDWSRSSKRVMTLDWIEGAPLTDKAALDKAGADRGALAIQVTRGFLAAALDHGFFHADMHEGNLIYGKDGKLWTVDFGIMGRIGHNERRYLAEILYGFLHRDYKRVAEVHAFAGYVPDRFTVEEFAQALRAIGEPIFGKTADGISMSKLLLQLFDVTHLFGMHLRPELVLLQKTMVQVEGVSRALDPHHDMWNAARPIVERWVRRELGVEGVTRRTIDEAAHGLAQMRRLPQAVSALENLANRFAHQAPAHQTSGVHWTSFWIGAGAAALLILIVFAAKPAPEPQMHIIEREIISPASEPSFRAPPTNLAPAIPDIPPGMDVPEVDPNADFRAQ